jgi:protein-L-isoaspartate(D-aspartate) O-methyltransferase
MKSKALLIFFILIVLSTGSCRKTPNHKSEPPLPTINHKDQFSDRRNHMVEIQLKGRGIKDERVLQAMLKVERHKFVPPNLVNYAYHDYPLSIGEEQTISQPYIVALMTELMELKGNERVLEIGTGSGYQAAILAEIAKKVFTIEIIPTLATRAKQKLDSLGYQNIQVRTGDGYQGWVEFAPFDAIIVTAAPKHIPPPLLEQLKGGGHLVLPLGAFNQELLQITKNKDGTTSKKSIIPVRFVPMTGEAQTK